MLRSLLKNVIVYKLDMYQSTMLYSSPDARGLTDAINATGTVYEEIGNMHGEQVM